MLDSAGRLIGINTAIYSPSGASAGIGFAVPVDTVMRVVPQIIRNGKYISPSLGIEVNEAINQRLVSILQVQGVVVLKVIAGSSAEKAGLRSITVYRDGRITPGDVIVEIAGKKIDTVGKLQAKLDNFKIGDKVKVTILREGKRMEVDLVLQPNTN